jgi:hypothetical protein
MCTIYKMSKAMNTLPTKAFWCKNYVNKKGEIKIDISMNVEQFAAFFRRAQGFGTAEEYAPMVNSLIKHIIECSDDHPAIQTMADQITLKGDDTICKLRDRSTIIEKSEEWAPA